MNRSKLAVLVGALCAVVFAFSMVSTAMAAEDFQRWAFGVQGMYIAPDDDVELDGVSIADAFTAGINIEYFVTENIGVELVAAVAKHDLELSGLGTVGSLWILPPSLYAKYHFMTDSMISPYIGAGVNWVYAWDEQTILGDTEIDDSFGWAAKVGADIKITDSVFANVDIMYLDVDTDGKIDGVGSFDVEVNPWVYSAGLKYRF